MQCSSGIDTFGYLYQGTFYPSSLTTNLIAQNDDAFGTSDFGFTVYLQPGITYVLVVTTYNEGHTTEFMINASGPGDVYFDAINTNI